MSHHVTSYHVISYHIILFHWNLRRVPLKIVLTYEDGQVVLKQNVLSLSPECSLLINEVNMPCHILFYLIFSYFDMPYYAVYVCVCLCMFVLLCDLICVVWCNLYIVSYTLERFGLAWCVLLDIRPALRITIRLISVFVIYS